MGTRRSWLPAVLAGLLLLVYLATASPAPSVDAASASLQGWRIATSGAPWLEGVDLEATPYSYDDQPFWTGEAEHGHVVVFRSPGVTAVSVLAYLGADESPTAFRIRPASMVAATLTWLAVVLLYMALRSRLGTRSALMASAVVALGTPMWTVAADAIWPHTLTVLGLAGMAFAASRDRWLLAGIFGGAGLAGRLHFSLVVAVLGLGVGMTRRRWRVTALVAAGSVPFLALCAAWSRWLYGQWDPAGGYPQVDAYADRATSESIASTFVNELGLWVSLDRGFLIWTPIVMILLPALVRSWKQQPDWSRMMLLGGLLYTGVQGLMNHFAGGDSFYGYRLTLELLMSSAPALSFAARHAGAVARPLAALVAGLQVAPMASGAVFDSPGLPLEDAWRANTFAMVVIDHPVVGVAWLLCGVMGLAVFRRFVDSRADGDPAVASAAEQPRQ